MPVIVTVVRLVTALVDTANAAVVAPAGMVTLDGTVAAAVLLLARDTTIPPAGAVAVIDTEPWDVLPPTTVDGFNVSPLSAGLAVPTVTVRLAFNVTPPYRAPRVAVVVELGTLVPMVKETLVWPAGTVTDAGMLTTGLFVSKVMFAPVAGAAAVSVTLPTALVPAETDAGEIV